MLETGSKLAPCERTRLDEMRLASREFEVVQGAVRIGGMLVYLPS